MSRQVWLPVLCLLGALSAVEPAAAQPLIDAFGDSVTKGAFPFDELEMGGYPKRLQKLLRQEGLETARVRNHGIGGEKTPAALSRLDGVLGNGGDVFILMEGTNDVTAIAEGSLSLETTLFNLGQMNKKAQARGFETIMATVIPRRPDAQRDRWNHITLELVLGIRDMAARSGQTLAE